MALALIGSASACWGLACTENPYRFNNPDFGADGWGTWGGGSAVGMEGARGRVVPVGVGEYVAWGRAGRNEGLECSLVFGGESSFQEAESGVGFLPVLVVLSSLDACGLGDQCIQSGA